MMILIWCYYLVSIYQGQKSGDPNFLAITFLKKTLVDEKSGIVELGESQWKTVLGILICLVMYVC